MARKLGKPTYSRLVVSRALELEDKGTNTGLGLGLVAEMNLVELGLVVYLDSDWWWYMAMVYVDSDWWLYMAAAMYMVGWWYMVMMTTMVQRRRDNL